MSLAVAEDARIDSRLATLLLVSVFSFALGIFISLMATQQQDERPAYQPCPTRCPRLILMSSRRSADGGDECAPIMLPSAYSMPNLITAR